MKFVKFVMLHELNQERNFGSQLIPNSDKCGNYRELFLLFFVYTTINSFSEHQR